MTITVIVFFLLCILPFKSASYILSVDSFCGMMYVEYISKIQNEKNGVFKMGVIPNLLMYSSKELSHKQIILRKMIQLAKELMQFQKNNAA